MAHLTINTQLSSTPAHTSVEQKETEAQARLPILATRLPPTSIYSILIRQDINRHRRSRRFIGFWEETRRRRGTSMAPVRSSAAPRRSPELVKIWSVATAPATRRKNSADTRPAKPIGDGRWVFPPRFDTPSVTSRQCQPR